MKSISNQFGLYLSADPETKFNSQILNHPLVHGVRINTGAKRINTPDIILSQFQENMNPLPVYIDLKARELRIIKDAVVPHDYLELNHAISVKTPTAMYYNEGKDFLIIDHVIDERKLVIRPPKSPSSGTPVEIRFGKNASLNIPDASLQVHGYLTANDLEYIRAAKKMDLHRYLLSFVEDTADLNALWDLDPEAQIWAKIESKKGLNFVKNQFESISHRPVRLLAARADLFIELDQPHEILACLQQIIKADPYAIAASRLLYSFLDPEGMVSCADLCDIGFLWQLGYRDYLIGDEICGSLPILMNVIGCFDAIQRQFNHK